MDNFEIDVVGEGDESLRKALEIAFTHNGPGSEANFYKVVRLKVETAYYANEVMGILTENLAQAPGYHVHHIDKVTERGDGHLTLILLWADDGHANPLPFPMSVDDAFAFVKGWLAKAGDPGPRPDIDGSLEKGWRIFTEAWGHVAGCGYSIAGIQSRYAMYGK